MFEKDWYGDEVALEALLDGWRPDKDYRFRPNKTVYARVLFYEHGWTRAQLIDVLHIAPRMLTIQLKAVWLGVPPESEWRPPPAVPTDYKTAYEGALIREKQWKDEADDLRRKLQKVREYAAQLQESHPLRTEKATLVGRDLMRMLT